MTFGMRGLSLLASVLALSSIAVSADAAPLQGEDSAAALVSPYLPVADSGKPDKAAEKTIRDMAGRAIAFLGDEKLSQSQRKIQFRQLLRNNYDMKTIAKFALGRYWRAASDGQRQEYLGLFETMIVEVYSRRFEDYHGQEFVVKGSRTDEAGGVIVNSAIVQENGTEVKVDWRVRNKDAGYKVIDVIVEGVSMALTQRSDFAAVIQRGGGDLNVLLAHMRNPEKIKKEQSPS